MKIRLGFISNSSSSSFVILGQKIDKDKALEYRGRGDIYIHGIDEVCGEGEDFFVMDDEIKKALMNNSLNIRQMDRLDFYIVYEMVEDDLEITSEYEKYMPFRVYHFSISYHITRDIGDFLERYDR